MVPLIDVSTNDRFERGDNLLCDLAADFTVAQGGAVVRNGGQQMRIVGAAVSGQIDWQDDAAGGSRQFRRTIPRGAVMRARSFAPRKRRCSGASSFTRATRFRIHVARPTMKSLVKPRSRRIHIQPMFDVVPLHPST